MKADEPRLVEVATSDGLYLQGYFVPGNGESALLHIHGFEGNFYENKFVLQMAEKAKERGLAFLTVNTRGSEKEKDFNTTDGKIKTIGSRYELLEEAHLDITAWIKFLVAEGYQKIVLSGHSQGTYKVTRYLFEGELKDKINKLVLLSPLDMKGEEISSGRTDIDGLLKKAQSKIDNGNGNELVPSEFDEFPESYSTFVSLYRQDELGRMFDYGTQDYDFPILKQIKIPTKIIIGSKDEFFTLTEPSKALEILLENIPNSEGKIIDGAVHSFAPHQDVLAEEVISFV